LTMSNTMMKRQREGPLFPSKIAETQGNKSNSKTPAAKTAGLALGLLTQCILCHRSGASHTHDKAEGVAAG
jgi:mono/diheme cytochrome c family protein